MNNEFNGNNNQGFNNPGNVTYGNDGLSYQSNMNNNGMGMQQPMQQNMGMNNGMDMQQPMQPNMDMNNSMDMQQPMQSNMNMNPVMDMQQPMQQNMGMNNGMDMQQPIQQNIAKPKGGFSLKGINFKDKKTLLIPGIVVLILVLILLINVIGTKTIKCDNESESDGVVTKTSSKAVFKFGKPVSESAEMVIDYSDADYDDDQVDSIIDYLEDVVEESCDEDDGCTYKIKEGKDKITITMKDKYTKDEKEDFEDMIDDDYDGDIHDYYDEIEDSCDD